MLLAIGTLAALARLPRLQSVTPYTLLVAAQSVALFAAAALGLWQGLRLLPLGYHRLAQHGTQVGAAVVGSFRLILMFLQVRGPSFCPCR